MSDAPAISVLMAVYNGEPYLRQSVESILAQTRADFELIVIDDGSTDGSKAILESYAAVDPRVRLISRANRGLTVSLTEALSLARGKWLARMDADDVSMPDRFERQADYLQQHPRCVLVGSAVLLIDPQGLPIRTMCSEQTHEQIDQAHLNCGWPVVHPAVMMNTQAVRQVGGYREKYNTLEDLDLFLRLAEVGELANLPQVLLHYRQHFDSVTHTRSLRQQQLRQAIFDETAQRRRMPQTPKAPSPTERDRPRSLQHRLWAWSALKAGNVVTARKHALASVRHAPWSGDSWRVLACAVRGH